MTRRRRSHTLNNYRQISCIGNTLRPEVAPLYGAPVEISVECIFNKCDTVRALVYPLTYEHLIVQWALRPTMKSPNYTSRGVVRSADRGRVSVSAIDL